MYSVQVLFGGRFTKKSRDVSRLVDMQIAPVHKI